LKGVGAVTAAQLIRTHGGVAGLIRDGGLGDRDREYLARALRVAQPTSELGLELPEGRRASYPLHAEALAALAAGHGLRSSCDRLLEALAL
jgi:hypothetical protein